MHRTWGRIQDRSASTSHCTLHATSPDGPRCETTSSDRFSPVGAGRRFFHGARILFASCALWTAACSGSTGPLEPVEGEAPGEPLAAAVAEDIDVVLHPGQSIQAAVDANPPGTTYLLRAGVYAGQTVVPQDYDVFVGEVGTVLDGLGSTRFAFKGAARGVVLRELEITGYTGLNGGLGAIQAYDGRGWRLENLNVHHNATAGAVLRFGAVVDGGSYHHNGRLGILVSMGADVIIENADISYNNYERRYEPLWAAGGIKVADSQDVVIRFNRVHHNLGPGIWYDLGSRRGRVRTNEVRANAYSGIFYETSYDAVIYDNLSVGNGTDTNGVHGSGILISESPGVRVQGNEVRQNKHGIVAKQNHRVDGKYGSLRVRDLFVRGNVVQPGPGASGLLDVIGDGEIFKAEANNTFDRNTYYVAGNAKPFWGPLKRMTVPQWRATGQDRHSTFFR